jgi:hypothetical protein
MWAVDSGIPFVNADTCEHFKSSTDVVPKSKVERAFSDLKKEIHDKAVYPHLSGIEPYISLKVFDAVINKLIGS